jgi:hypothetical protein
MWGFFMCVGYLYIKQHIMYKNFNLTESEKEQILKQHQSQGYKKSLNEQYEDEFSSDMGNEMESNDINLQEQLLFIVENLDGGHSEDINVTPEKMVEVLKQTIKEFVNPSDTIPVKNWENLYYSITNDSYA